MKTALVILILLFSFQLKAAGICDDNRTLSNLWQTKYSPLFQSISNDFTPTSHAFKISQALCLLENARVPNYDFFAYFKKFVSLAMFRPDVVTSNMAKSNYSIKGIEIFNLFFDPDPIMDYKRASVLVHEARHLDLLAKGAPNSTHVICVQGVEAGNRNCDDQFIPNWDEAGPYSYEVMFFRKLYDQSPYAFNKNFLKIWIKDILDNSFNYVSAADKERFTRN